MKINFLTPHLKISGGVRVILIYADFLARRGHDVNILVQSRRWLRRTAANILAKKPFWFKNLSAKILRVESYDERNMPQSDVVAASNFKDASCVANYSDKMGRKFYFVQHDERLYHGERSKVDEAFRLPLKKIVVSTWLKEVFEKEYGQTPELLLNSVDKILFHPVVAAKNENGVRVLLLDHSYEWKGTKEGAELIYRLKEKYPHLKLIMFGSRRENIDSPCDEYYYNLAQKKLAWLYSSCDIFLCPSWDEGFGLPSLEAMACQCAVVTYDNGGSRDFAFDGQTAFVAPRRDREAFFQELELAAGNKNLRERIARAGYEFAQKMSSWEEQAGKMENIFKEAIKQNA